MNAKFSFALSIVIALLAACSPTGKDISTPMDPAQPADNESSGLVPVTGDAAAESIRPMSEPRLQSGEIFLSDNNSPDSALNVQTGAQQDLQDECISEDSLTRRHGGCVE